jgi:hypothetical protein
MSYDVEVKQFEAICPTCQIPYWIDESKYASLICHGFHKILVHIREETIDEVCSECHGTLESQIWHYNDRRTVTRRERQGWSFDKFGRCRSCKNGTKSVTKRTFNPPKPDDSWDLYVPSRSANALSCWRKRIHNGGGRWMD